MIVAEGRAEKSSRHKEKDFNDSSLYDWLKVVAVQGMTKDCGVKETVSCEDTNSNSPIAYS